MQNLCARAHVHKAQAQKAGSLSEGQAQASVQQGPEKAVGSIRFVFRTDEVPHYLYILKVAVVPS